MESGDGSPSRPVWHLWRRKPFTVLGYEFLMNGIKPRRFSSLSAAKKYAAKLEDARERPPANPHEC
jgi:hypothetical protein